MTESTHSAIMNQLITDGQQQRNRRTTKGVIKRSLKRFLFFVDGIRRGTLKKRELIGVEGEPSDAYNVTVVKALYAELERQAPDYPEESTI